MMGTVFPLLTLDKTKYMEKKNCQRDSHNSTQLQLILRYLLGSYSIVRRFNKKPNKDYTGSHLVGMPFETAGVKNIFTLAGDHVFPNTGFS
ncbi:MAG: hypothetical protein CM1200mP3_11420 [Chloroflexota bacterium]|nr:MAG: hypothetical protein CM1200mP3_11420 [Chloroflexota bacterium]